MIGTVLDIILVVAVLAAVVCALVAPGRMVASMAFLILGLLAAIVWARLAAPDIALAEAAIASGLTGALLVAAATEHPGDRSRVARPWLWAAGATVGGVVAAGLSTAFVAALRDGAAEPRLGGEALDTVPDTPVSHPITAVLLDFRAYDTLLEVAVLTAAALAAAALHRGGTLNVVALPIDRRPLLSAYVRVAVPVLLIIAAWLLVAGSTRTGGAFQAGAILTGAVLVLMLSGRLPMHAAVRWWRLAAVSGLSVFLLAAGATAAFSTGWLALEEPWGGGLVLLIETALTIGIGAALAALFVAGFPDTEPGSSR